MAGVVEQLTISPKPHQLPSPVEHIEVVPGQGPRGDRKFIPEPKKRKGKDLTLIEAEALEGLRAETGIEMTHEESRRNVLTRGIRLNDLVGKRFRVGEVECEGVVLNDPCTHLESMTYPGVQAGLDNRGGLRANVLNGGTIKVGDDVAELSG
ncbi:MAG TPA: MOSC domain-containing protein [Thermoleophilaceae bacterium]